MVVKVKVYGPSREETIVLCDTKEQFKRITVLQLKEKIKTVFRISDDFILVFQNQRLEEGALLSDYGIQHMSEIQTVLRLPGGGARPEMGDGGMGDREGRNQSMDRLQDFSKCTVL